jgi:hypothetical protein
LNVTVAFKLCCKQTDEEDIKSIVSFQPRRGNLTFINRPKAIKLQNLATKLMKLLTVKEYLVERVGGVPRVLDYIAGEAMKDYPRERVV